MNNKKEKIGKFLYILSSCLFLTAAIFFVWSRNHFYDFGVYSPTIKPSDVLLVFSLGFFLVSIILSRELRSDREKNALLVRSIGVFCLFLFFLGLGLGTRLVLLKLPFTHEDIVELGRIFLGFTGLFLTFVFAFRNEKFAKLLFGSFLANIVLIPFLFFSTLSILKLLLVVSPVSYTFLGFRNSTIIFGFSMMITLVFAFSIYKAMPKSWLKVLFFILCCLLAAVLFWTGSRAGWLAAFVAMAAIVFMRKGNVKKIMFGIGETIFIFLLGFLILPTLVRNTVIIRILPHVNIPVSVSVPTDQYAFFQLPTREFIKNNDLVFDVGFQADRGDIWKTYAPYFIRHPLGVGPAYSDALGAKDSYFRHLNTHDLWLQLAMSGGIGALILAILVFVFAGREAWQTAQRHKDAVSVGLFGAFCGALIEVTLIDSLDLRWLWVFLGLIFVRGCNLKQQDIRHG